MSLQDCIKIIESYVDEAGIKSLKDNPYSWGKTRLKMLEGQRESLVDLIVDKIVANAISGKSTKLIKQSRLYGERKTKTVEFAETADLRVDSVDFAEDITTEQSIAPGSHNIAAAYSL